MKKVVESKHLGCEVVAKRKVG